ncbi:MAG: hypothetical protein ACI9MB_000536 [Verrucomicrobiales bacterium]|jgi:hypothetical protein
MFIQPFHLLLSALAHWANRAQAAIIDYLREENRVLRDRLDPKRLRFTDAERRRLAAEAKLVCRSALREIGSLVTPDTLIRESGKPYGTLDTRSGATRSPAFERITGSNLLLAGGCRGRPSSGPTGTSSPPRTCSLSRSG